MGFAKIVCKHSNQKAEKRRVKRPIQAMGIAMEISRSYLSTIKNSSHRVTPTEHQTLEG